MKLDGHLELVCDADAQGRTRIARQSFCAPVHLSKPFWDGNALVLNIASPTAGLLDGDRLRVEVEVRRGARLVLSTPAATRIHTMRAGRAEVTQHFQVQAGGALEVIPEMLIPQRGARYRQRTRIDVENGGELLFFEQLAPGRTAAGEAFAYDEILWATDLRAGGRAVARERFRLAPGENSLAGLRRQFATAYYGTALIVSDAWTPPGLDALPQDAQCWVGLSRLGGAQPHAHAHALKIVAGDSLHLRRAMHAARKFLHAAIGRPMAGLRRAGELTW